MPVQAKASFPSRIVTLTESRISREEAPMQTSYTPSSTFQPSVAVDQ